MSEMATQRYVATHQACGTNLVALAHVYMLVSGTLCTNSAHERNATSLRRVTDPFKLRGCSGDQYSNVIMK